MDEPIHTPSARGRGIRRAATALGLVACLAVPAFAGAPALAQEEEPPPALDLRVAKVVVPATINKLVDKGVRVKASCSIDCVLVVKVRVSEKNADRLGLRGTLIASGAAGAKGGQARWVTAPLNAKAGRALEDVSVSGRLDVRVKALP